MKFLVYFRGGPMNGKVYSTAQMFGAPEKMPFVDEYEWTNERVTSKETGKSAQVWQFTGYNEGTGTETT